MSSIGASCIPWIYACLFVLLLACRATYLLGVSHRRALVITRLDTNGDFESLAILPEITIDWDNTTPNDDAIERGGWGAAFAYVGSGSPRLFFSINEGLGIFELALPITFPDSCWNALDVETAAVCETSGLSTLRWWAASAVTAKNDGYNCRHKNLVFPATESPTTSPSVSPSASPTKIAIIDKGIFCASIRLRKTLPATI